MKHFNLINKSIARRNKIKQLDNILLKNIDYQKACIASQTIKLIAQKPNQKLLKKYSLRDRIVQTINSKSKYSNEAKHAITELFNQGIKRQQMIYTQQRVIFAQKNQKVAFCPNYLITKKVFNYILGQKKPSNIMQGHFGISKTFSFILYTQLSNLIVNYLIKYQNNQKNNQNDILPEELLKKSQNFTRSVIIKSKRNFTPHLLYRNLFFKMISKQFNQDQKVYVKQYKIIKVQRQMKSIPIKYINMSKRPKKVNSQLNNKNQNQIKSLMKYVKVKNKFKYTQKIALVPKMIYWSLNLQNTSQKSLYGILKNQFKQISTKLNNLSQCLAACQDYQNYSIETIVVVDQINLLVSAIKQNDRKFLQYSSKPQPNKQQQEQREDEKKRHLQLIKLIKKLGSYANYRIQLSSINMQESIILYMAKSRHQKQLISKRMIINFVKQLKQNKSILQLIDFFIFQLGNRLQSPNIPNIQQNWHLSTSYQAILFKKKIRNGILKVIKNWKQGQNKKQDKKNIFYLSPLHIRSFFMLDPQLSSKQTVIMREFEIKNKWQELKTIKNEEEFIIYCVKLIKNIISSSNQWYKQKLQDFLYHDNQLIRKFRVSMVSKVYQQAIQNILDKKRPKQFISLKFKDIPFVKEQISKIQRNFQLKKQSKYLLELYNFKSLLTNKNLFDLQNGEYIITRFTSDFVRLIFDKCLYTIILFIHNNEDNFKTWKLNQFDGPILQRSFYDTLTRGDINLTIRKDFDLQLIKVNKISDKKYPFLSIPKILSEQGKQPTLQVKEYKFLVQLKPTLNQMITDKVNNAVLLPVHRDFKQILLDLEVKQNTKYQSSIAIDLIIANIDQKSKKVILIAIDVTRSLHYNQVKNKLIKFLKYYDYMSDKNQKTINLNDQQYHIDFKYFVLGPKCISFNKLKRKRKSIINQSFNIINHTAFMNYYINNNKQTNLLTQIGNFYIENAVQINSKDKEAQNSQAWQVFKILKEKITQQTLTKI